MASAAERFDLGVRLDHFIENVAAIARRACAKKLGANLRLIERVCVISSLFFSVSNHRDTTITTLRFEVTSPSGALRLQVSMLLRDRDTSYTAHAQHDVRVSYGCHVRRPCQE